MKREPKDAHATKCVNGVISQIVLYAKMEKQKSVIRVLRQIEESESVFLEHEPVDEADGDHVKVTNGLTYRKIAPMDKTTIVMD